MQTEDSVRAIIQTKLKYYQVGSVAAVSGSAPLSLQAPMLFDLLLSNLESRSTILEQFNTIYLQQLSTPKARDILQTHLYQRLWEVVNPRPYVGGISTDHDEIRSGHCNQLHKVLAVYTDIAECSKTRPPVLLLLECIHTMVGVLGSLCNNSNNSSNSNNSKTSQTEADKACYIDCVVKTALYLVRRTLSLCNSTLVADATPVSAVSTTAVTSQTHTRTQTQSALQPAVVVHHPSPSLGELRDLLLNMFVSILDISTTCPVISAAVVEAIDIILYLKY